MCLFFSLFLPGMSSQHLWPLLTFNGVAKRGKSLFFQNIYVVINQHSNWNRGRKRLLVTFPSLFSSVNCWNKLFSWPCDIFSYHQMKFHLDVFYIADIDIIALWSSVIKELDFNNCFIIFVKCVWLVWFPFTVALACDLCDRIVYSTSSCSQGLHYTKMIYY